MKSLLSFIRIVKRGRDMMKDLRDWLKEVEKIGELKTIHQETDWNQEMTAITYMVDKAFAEKAPALLFENIRGYGGDHFREEGFKAVGSYTMKTMTWRDLEFERSAPHRPLWESRLTEDSRYDILAIKEAVCTLSEYRNTLLSVHIYEAVLEDGVQSIDEFWEWWNKHYGK